MKFVALVSGGKDSVYSILECKRQGHELIGCVHLGRPSVEDEESYMYQTAASEVLETLVEECLCVPLVLYKRVGKSLNTSLVYDKSSEGDEVEDLYEALLVAKNRFPEIEAISSGAILSTYQRVRIENVCSRLQLTSLSYLWRAAPQHELLQRMLDDGIHAVLVRTACPPGLLARKHLQKTLKELHDSQLFQRLNRRYQFHMCGEGGEYESLVLDCPVYKRRLVLDKVEILEPEDDGVGVLRILKCHAEDKEGDPSADAILEVDPLSKANVEKLEDSKEEPSTNPSSIQSQPTANFTLLPHVKRVGGGLFHVSEIVSPFVPIPKSSDNEADLAVKEACSIFGTLACILKTNTATAQDVLFVHLYLSEISHFSRINAHYQKFFGTLLPPSRSCVAVGRHVLPGSRRVLLDCFFQVGSGMYLRTLPSSPNLMDDPYASSAHKTATSKLREVLHVQSISHWAPVCVGPYSQVNTLRSGVHFLAGQIGLIPATMKLHSSWPRQLEQCWQNVASVLDALDAGTLEHIFSGVVYVSSRVSLGGDDDQQVMQNVRDICCHQLLQNGRVIPGKVDSPTIDFDDGIKDEAEPEEKDLKCPLLAVAIPEMPVGALVEVEVIAATNKSFSCLGLKRLIKCHQRGPVENESQESIGWDTGYDFHTPTSNPSNDEVPIETLLHALGNGCAAIGLVMAYQRSESSLVVDTAGLLKRMLRAFQDDLSMGWSTLGLGMKHVLHVRLFYVASHASENETSTVLEDGTLLRSALHAAIGSCWRRPLELPAVSIVPVNKIHLFYTRSFPDLKNSFMAMQILLIDPLHMESEIWIHHGREER